MAKEFISPENVHQARGYSHAVKVGNTVYVAGQVGCAPDGSVVPGGFTPQAERAFENLRLVLEAAGATLNDVVKLNTYLKDIPANRRAYNDVRKRYFPEPCPASTLVEIVNLAGPDLLIEVEAIAVIE